MSFLYYHITYNDMIKGLEDRVYSIHDYIVDNVDKSAFTDINSPEDMNTEIYGQAHDVFRDAHDLTGVMYLYSAKRNADGELIYVVDCVDPNAQDFRRPGDLIEPEIVPELKRALKGVDVMPREIKKTDWGKIFIAYLPIHVDGEIVGVIGVEFEAEHQYNTYHNLAIVTPIAASLICVLCSFIAKKLFRRISNPLHKDMFNTDFLTNLKSRNAFDIDVSNLAMSKHREGIGFYAIDLNNLKKVNDTFGHEAGDIYLQIAAHSFREAAGNNVSIYRTGGDEFVLLSTHDTVEKMEQLKDELIRVFDKNKPQWDINLSFSIGYALYDADEDRDLSDTYRRADAVMYECKRAFHAKDR